MTSPLEERVTGRVAWGETDAAGMFHFARALYWAEEAETALWRRLGALQLLPNMPRRRIEVDYLRPLEFDDAYETRLWLDSLGRTSIVWLFEVARGGEVCVSGRMVVVHVDADGLPVPLPPDQHDVLQRTF